MCATTNGGWEAGRDGYTLSVKDGPFSGSLSVAGGDFDVDVSVDLLEMETAYGSVTVSLSLLSASPSITTVQALGDGFYRETTCTYKPNGGGSPDNYAVAPVTVPSPFRLHTYEVGQGLRQGLFGAGGTAAGLGVIYAVAGLFNKKTSGGGMPLLVK